MWGQRAYVTKMKPKNRTKMATLRLGATNAQGDAIYREMTKCRLCKENHRETSRHLLVNCSSLSQARVEFAMTSNCKFSWMSVLKACEVDFAFVDMLESQFVEATQENLFPKVGTGISLMEEDQLDRVVEAARWVALQ
jgi:hypothetical protein